MLCRSAPPPFLLSAGLGLFCPGLAIPCSTCLHGHGWVRACPLRCATFLSWHRGTGCGGLLLFMGDWMTLARADLWPLGWLGSCQVQAPVDLAFPGYNSVVVATWLDPPCKLTQSLESDAGEGVEAALHIGHVLEWLIFFDSHPLLLVLPKIFEELSPQLLPFLLLVGGVIVVVEGPKDVVQVFPPPRTPVVSDVLQRVSRGSLCNATRLWRGLSRGGGWRDIMRHPSRVPTLLMRHLVTGLPDGGPFPSSPGVAGRLTVIISAFANLSLAYINISTASGGRLEGRGVKGDS